QFYNWYEDNTYLATTTTPEYTSNFPVGSHTMKVVLDNCLSLSESNITFNARNVYPTSLPAATGGLIHILSAGAFPHATTDEYVQDGLVVHYDGIDNQNLGDTNHSSDAVVWKDLSDNGYDVTLRVGHSGTSRGDATNAASVAECANSAWEDNGFLLGGYCYFAKVPADPTAANALSDIMPNLPFDNDNYTIESVFNMSKLTSPRGGFVGWGKQSTVNESNSLGFLWANNSINPTTPSFRHFWWTNDIDVRFTDANANSIKNIAITYDNDASASPNNRIFYYNGTTTSIEYIGNHCDDPLTYNCRNKTNKNTARCGSFYIGLAVANNTNDECVPAANGAVHYSRGNKIFSIRIYNKTLSSDEILANYKVDKLRFAATPIVKIGPKQCTNVVVHSDRLITCQAPAGTSGTTVNVEVISAEDSSRILLLENEFKYQ
ncbi:MAG: IPT/TIG domain-containing protein, partial [Prevotellaceae bacterium]|nr:IPT/TIG domain-containing protein [Prevotellaceae bacterium]